MEKILIGPFHHLLTLEHLSLNGSLHDTELFPIKQAGVLIQNGMILETNNFEKLTSSADRILEIPRLCIALPGFIDSHTHICFGGSRAHDYAMRNSGKTYLEIARLGGGIWDTVQKTRATNQNALVGGIVTRANRHLTEGVTTIEVKSGYGLSVKEELKMLEAIKQANERLQADLISTCLAAHLLPKDFDGNPQDYLTFILNKILPLVKNKGLSRRVDAFIEEEAFDPEMTLKFFLQAKAQGFDITVHADQFHVGGSKAAVEAEALSADHLEASGDQEIAMLAKSKTMATALPGASMGLGLPFAPGRKLLNAGASLAIASDWNPGSAPMGDLLLQASVFGAYEKLSNAEVLAGITYRAAHALRLHDRGKLLPGMKADLIVFETNHIADIFYYQGKMKPMMVFKNGQLAHKQQK